MVEASSYFSGLCWSCSFLGPVVVVSIIRVPWAQHTLEEWAGGGGCLSSTSTLIKSFNKLYFVKIRQPDGSHTTTAVTPMNSAGIFQLNDPQPMS